MAEFDAKHRNLDEFLAWLEKSKEGNEEDGGKEEAQDLDSGGERIEIKKENVPSNRGLQRLSTAAIAKHLLTSK